MFTITIPEPGDRVLLPDGREGTVESYSWIRDVVIVRMDSEGAALVTISRAQIAFV